MKNNSDRFSFVLKVSFDGRIVESSATADQLPIQFEINTLLKQYVSGFQVKELEDIISKHLLNGDVITRQFIFPSTRGEIEVESLFFKSDSEHFFLVGKESSLGGNQWKEYTVESVETRIDTVLDLLQQQFGQDADYCTRENEIIQRISELKTIFLSKDKRGTETDLSSPDETGSPAGELSIQFRKIRTIHKISELIANPEARIDEILIPIANMLPRATRHSESIRARIILDLREYRSEDFRPSKHVLKSSLKADAKYRGCLELHCIDGKKTTEEQCFSNDEKELLETVAHRISSLIEQRQLVKKLDNARRELLLQNEIANIFLIYEGEELYENILLILLSEQRFSPCGLCIPGPEGIHFYYLEMRSGTSQENHQGLQILELSQKQYQSILDQISGREMVGCDSRNINLCGHFDKSFCTILPLSSRDRLFGCFLLNTNNREPNNLEKERLYQFRQYIEPVLYLRVQKDSRVYQHRVAELALKDSERRYRTLVENVEEGIGIVDLEENFLFANNSAAAIFGTEKENLVGANLKEFLLDKEMKFIQEETLQRINDISSRYELGIIRKDTGEERIILVTATPRIIHNGDVTGTFGVFRDITDAKKAQAELTAHREHLEEMVTERTIELERLNQELELEIQEKTKTQNALDDSRSKYQMVVDNSTNAIAVLVNDALQFANPRFLDIFGISTEDLKSFDLIACIDPIHHQLISERFERVLSDEPVSQSEQFKILLPGDIEKWLESKEAKGLWEGEPALLLFLTDITQEKMARESAERQKEQLVQADKMASLGTLVAGVAHEINNPNNYILLSAQTMADAWKAALPVLNEYYKNSGDFSLGGVPYSRMKDKLATLSDGVFESSLRIKELVNNLKDYSRQGSSEINQDVDLNEVVKSAITLMENPIRKSTTDFNLDLQDPLPPVKGNFNRLVQVLVNLIQNALEALTDVSDSVLVRTFSNPVNGKLTVEVIDSGEGIEESHSKMAMDPFFTTKRDQGGTGLGLSISSGIIKDHGGVLTLEGNPDKGATARIILEYENQKAGEL